MNENLDLLSGFVKVFAKLNELICHLRSWMIQSLSKVYNYPKRQ
jgi:hypothetical protein